MLCRECDGEERRRYGLYGLGGGKFRKAACIGDGRCLLGGGRGECGFRRRGCGNLGRDGRSGGLWSFCWNWVELNWLA